MHLCLTVHLTKIKISLNLVTDINTSALTADFISCSGNKLCLNASGVTIASFVSMCCMGGGGEGEGGEGSTLSGVIGTGSDNGLSSLSYHFLASACIACKSLCFLLLVCDISTGYFSKKFMKIACK